MAMTPDAQNHAPTAQTGDGAGVPQGDKDWLTLAQSAYQQSTSYLDSNLRKEWEDSIRAFNNQHPSDSKYNQPAYEKRSKVYRPRVRTVIRKNEAAAAAAFFSNMDVVSVDANDPSDKAECANAVFMKQLLQYRLTKTIPWYQILLGGLQEAQKVGAVCSHTFWEYEEEPEPKVAAEARESLTMEAGEEEYPQQVANGIPAGAVVADGKGGLSEPGEAASEAPAPQPVKRRIRKDKPVTELVPLENIRFDPGASWIDPVNTSPYWIHLMPMYVMDVKARMASGEWRKLSDAVIASSSEAKSDSTRSARQANRDDPQSGDTSSIGDYQLVWVQRHIHRKDGKDWEFYTIGDRVLLCDPEPLEEVVLHGIRPYVLGVCNLETGRIIPASVPTLASGLSSETNEIANQRLDNIKFVLNKKYLVKRGKEADVMGLLRNVPGGVAMMDDPQGDVRELSWPDVTASAFQEAQGIGMEMDELLGNFNPASLMMNGAANNPARNMALLGNSNGTLVEYMLRTYVETFVQPTLRQIVRIEQEYETDEVVMKIAAKKADLVQTYGINEVTDDLLKRELTLTVNVGMGATDPVARLNKFILAISKYVEMLQKPVPGIDMKEVGKEIFGHLGYADGSRFFSVEDPQLLQLQQQLQHAQGVIGQLQKKLTDKTDANKIALQKTLAATSSADRRAALGSQTTERVAAMKEEGANKRALATHWRALNEKAIDHAHDIHTRQPHVFGAPRSVQ